MPHLCRVTNIRTVDCNYTFYNTFRANIRHVDSTNPMPPLAWDQASRSVRCRSFSPVAHPLPRPASTRFSTETWLARENLLVTNISTKTDDIRHDRPPRGHKTCGDHLQRETEVKHQIFGIASSKMSRISRKRCWAHINVHLEVAGPWECTSRRKQSRFSFFHVIQNHLRYKVLAGQLLDTAHTLGYHIALVRYVFSSPRLGIAALFSHLAINSCHEDVNHSGTSMLL